MTYMRSRLFALPTTIVTIVCFLAMLLPPRVAKADLVDGLAPVPDGTGGPRSLATAPPPASSPQALVSVDPSTGSAVTSVTIELPRARGHAQPSLALDYDSSRGAGFGGPGWTLSVSSIVRKGASGRPDYEDPIFGAPGTITDPRYDDYLVDGKLLVPICALSAGGGSGLYCSSATDDEQFPQTLAGQSLLGWGYFRTEIDDGIRYFLSPDGLTWIAQSKSGNVAQYGKPKDGLFSTGLEMENGAVPAIGAPGVYRWDLVRNTDESGNTVYYVWSDLEQQGLLYLTDIYDTPPPSQIQSPQSASFAHHVRLSWEAFVQTPAASPVWRAVPAAQISTIDVTSATWGGGAPRQLNRRA